jgi:acyl-CoA synthetase (AMP-forming)/AMP-acid ligase II
MPQLGRALNDASFRSVGVLLDSHRQRTPAKTAIIDVERNVSLSFAELAALVDAIGRQLQQRGMGRGSRIVLGGGESLEKLLLWLGIWRIGAVVCPLDFAFAGATISGVVLDTLAPALILLPQHDSVFPLREDVPLLRFGPWPSNGTEGADVLPDVLQFAPMDGVEPPALDAAGRLEDAASICSTSGTSGAPKLVFYDHACYWYNGLDSIDVLGLGPQDRMLEYRSFDWYSAQILSLMPFLQLGSTLCVAQRFSRSGFVSWIAENRVSVCVGVPAVLNILVESPVEVSEGSLDSLRLMTCSTAPLSPLQWQRFEERYGVRVLSMYGSSEAGWMCASRLSRRKMSTVGYPAPHIHFEIVDADGKPCGPDQEGQVVVSGAKLALGLLLKDGSLEPIRGRRFHTRDFAVCDAEGFVRVLGRMDDLIIRGGVKIVPQEIEDVLLAHPAVQEAAALGVPDLIYGQEPACFVVTRPGGTLDADTILAHCRQQLPREKLPKYVYLVESLPRSTRGKILRDVLRREWWTEAHAAQG